MRRVTEMAHFALNRSLISVLGLCFGLAGTACGGAAAANKGAVSPGPAAAEGTPSAAPAAAGGQFAIADAPTNGESGSNRPKMNAAAEAACCSFEISSRMAPWVACNFTSRRL